MSRYETSSEPDTNPVLLTEHESTLKRTVKPKHDECEGSRGCAERTRQHFSNFFDVFVKDDFSAQLIHSAELRDDWAGSFLKNVQSTDKRLHVCCNRSIVTVSNCLFFLFRLGNFWRSHSFGAANKSAKEPRRICKRQVTGMTVRPPPLPVSHLKPSKFSFYFTSSWKYE